LEKTDLEGASLESDLAFVNIWLDIDVESSTFTSDEGPYLLTLD
jgi:hypothetical protein